jgi:large subunit ribosomal protein L22
VIIMAKFGYAFQNYDATKHVRASLREKDISHKHAREIAVTLKGMSIERARDFLQRVVNLESAVPMRRYKTQVGHKSDTGVMAGRYPEKSAKEFIKLLDNLEANAEYKGMDLDRLKIVNATVHKGVLVKRFIPRAFGRASPRNNVLTHVELVAQEV